MADLHAARDAMRRLIDMFDADIIANLQPPASRSPRARALIRQHAAEQVAGCCGHVHWPSLTGTIHLSVIGSQFPKNTVDVIDPRHVATLPASLCPQHVDRCLDAAGSPHVLLVGDDAVRLWRTDVTVDEVDGIIGVWANKFMVAAVPQFPAAGRMNRVDWFADARRTVRLLLDDLVGGISGRCVRCIQPAVMFDQDALPWCAAHRLQEPEVDVRVRLFE